MLTLEWKLILGNVLLIGVTRSECIHRLKKAHICSFLTCRLWETHNLTRSHACAPARVQRQLSCPPPAGGKHSDIELRHKSSTYSNFCSTHAPCESFFVWTHIHPSWRYTACFYRGTQNACLAFNRDSCGPDEKKYCLTTTSKQRYTYTHFHK